MMLKRLVHRLLAVVPVLLMVSIIVFAILRLTPGDPAAVIAGNTASSAEIESIRESLGLNRSLVSQYLIWARHALSGDLGYSYYLNKPVLAVVMPRFGPTASLALGTLLIAVAVALPLGTAAARHRGGRLDRWLSGLSVAGFSVPSFAIAYLLIYVFAIKLGWLPVQGYRRLLGPNGLGLWDWARHLVLPWATLAIVYVALIAKITRSAVVETLNQDYIRTARAKGLGETTVLVRHALANAAVPIVTVIGIGIAVLIGGVVVTETVFAIPGLGSLVVDAVLNRDFPIIQGVVLYFSIAYVGINLLVDLSYTVLDPRIRA